MKTVKRCFNTQREFGLGVYLSAPDDTASSITYNWLITNTQVYGRKSDEKRIQIPNYQPKGILHVHVAS